MRLKRGAICQRTRLRAGPLCLEAVVPLDPKDPDERVALPLDPEEALRALLQVDPDAPAADEAERIDEDEAPA